MIFGGNALLFLMIIFYVAWWTLCFRQNSVHKPRGAVFLITVAVLLGLAGIIITSLGIASASHVARALPVIYILIGAVVLYVVLLVFTKTVFERKVTSELLLITIWAAVESSAIVMLQAIGRLAGAQALVMAGVVLIATFVGIVCYVLYYRLEGMARFGDGLIPLLVDAVAVATFLAILAHSSVPSMGL